MQIKNLISGIKEIAVKNIRFAVFAIDVCFLAFCAAAVEKAACMADGSRSYMPERVFLYSAMLAGIYMVLAFRKYLETKLHYMLFALVVLSGLASVCALPKSVGLSWDDQIHYERALDISYGLKGTVSEADKLCIDNQFNMAVLSYDYLCSPEGRKEWEAGLNSAGSGRVGIVTKGGISMAAYLPAAFGLALGRALGFDYVTVFMLGKFFNLVTYAFLMACAVKQLAGKGGILMAVIALLPTNLFIASAYSYDYWVTAFISLGYAIAAAQLGKGSIDIRKWAAAAIFIGIGCLPKAVYLFLVFPLLFVGTDKFGKKKDRSVSLAVSITIMLALLLSFLLPLVIRKGGPGDTRGGAQPVPAEQIRFILTHPVRYLFIVLDFLKGFLSFDYLAPFLNSFCIMGDAEGHVFAAVVLGIAAVMENDGKRKGSVRFKAGLLCGIAATIMLIVTALYISFCDVGGIIMGVQARYLWPMLFPALYFGLDMKIAGFSPDAKRILSAIILLVFPVMFYSGILNLCLV